ncbi:MAG TPA: ribokinase [Roseiflexaceae bacterium]|nr:ribokinase [Roseiflexaceae bacterium]
MSILVFGSINMDLVTRTPRLPAAGETLIGHTFFTAPGGKGANQAVVCARLGAPTDMVGRIGDDVFAESLRTSLQTYGVDTRFVTVAPGPSGLAAIAVSDAAENTIIVIAGANNHVGEADIARMTPALAQARVLLLQLEVPLAAVIAAAAAAREHGVLVVLDPAPAQELPAELYRLVDIITPNETEAALLTGVMPGDDTAAVQAAHILLERGVRHAVIKLGARGALLANADGTHIIPAFSVTAVDTVAAGDAFNGGLAVGLDAGLPLTEALRLAAATGALAVTKEGAQQAMPTRAEVDTLLGS